MKCGFCGRELDNNVSECPYCHYQIERDTQVLSPKERDTFEGITIEEDGSANDSSVKDERKYQEEYKSNYRQNGFKVRTFNFSSGLLLTLLIIGGILALFFFLLPAFLVIAAVGAVVLFLLKLFM